MLAEELFNLVGCVEVGRKGVVSIGDACGIAVGTRWVGGLGLSPSNIVEILHPISVLLLY
jgi:hypothetical protein